MGQFEIKSESLFHGYYIDATVLPNIGVDTNKKDKIGSITKNELDVVIGIIEENYSKKNVFLINCYNMKLIFDEETIDKFFSYDNLIIFGLAFKFADQIERRKTNFANIKFNTINDNTIVFHKKIDSKVLDKIFGVSLFETGEILSAKTFWDIDARIRKNMIGDYLFNKVDKGIEYINSSNIYTNMYVNIKSVMLNLTITNMIIQEMVEIVQHNFNGEIDDIEFIGVSINGAILAELLSYHMKNNGETAFAFVNKLGPKYNHTILDSTFIPKPKKKYILISDFICLGTEFKKSQILFQNSTASLNGCICIAKVEDIYRDENGIGYDDKKDIYSIVGNINKLKRSFNYKVSYLKDNSLVEVK